MGDRKSGLVCSGCGSGPGSGCGSGSGSGLTVALPQFDGFVIFQGG